MNDPMLHLNEKDSKDMKIRLRKKNGELIPIPTRCTFLFGGPIINTPKLSVLSSKQFYVE